MRHYGPEISTDDDDDDGDDDGRVKGEAKRESQKRGNRRQVILLRDPEEAGKEDPTQTSASRPSQPRLSIRRKRKGTRKNGVATWCTLLERGT